MGAIVVVFRQNVQCIMDITATRRVNFVAPGKNINNFQKTLVEGCFWYSVAHASKKTGHGDVAAKV